VVDPVLGRVRAAQGVHGHVHGRLDNAQARRLPARPLRRPDRSQRPGCVAGAWPAGCSLLAHTEPGAVRIAMRMRAGCCRLDSAVDPAAVSDPQPEGYMGGLDRAGDPVVPMPTGHSRLWPTRRRHTAGHRLAPRSEIAHAICLAIGRSNSLCTTGILSVRDRPECAGEGRCAIARQQVAPKGSIAAPSLRTSVQLLAASFL
jgi:hypothetical protein